MKHFIGLALLLTSLSSFALNNPCVENKDQAISDLITSTAELVVGNQVNSTDFKNEIIVETLGGSVVLSLAGKVQTSKGEVVVMGTFECSELTTRYVLRGLTVSK